MQALLVCSQTGLQLVRQASNAIIGKATVLVCPDFEAPRP